jgi:hypothetical protein
LFEKLSSRPVAPSSSVALFSGHTITIRFSASPNVTPIEELTGIPVFGKKTHGKTPQSPYRIQK